jgi:hypothetical protein
VKINETEKRIYVRQSWLGDMAICPERARLGHVRPDLRTGSDATIIGTALHAGIESVLDNRSKEFGDMLEVVANEYETLETTNYKKTNIDEEKIPAYLESMSLAFYNNILPNVELGGSVEHYFQAPLGIEINGYGIWLEGTMDYITPSGVIWDWKTSSRTYNIKDKQKSAVQPTVYADAAVQLGLCPDYPVQFRYGIMVRTETPKHQIATVERTEQHGLWLRHLVRGAVTSALKTGYDDNWFMNDSSTLCSQAWCSYWEICKGAWCGDREVAFANQSLTD